LGPKLFQLADSMFFLPKSGIFENLGRNFRSYFEILNFFSGFPEPVVAKNLALLSSTVTKIASMVKTDSDNFTEYEDFLMTQQDKMR
jgi:hypothetical protein